MSQDTKALEIARNVKPRTVGAFLTGPSNQDCFAAADCIAAQAEHIEALERQLAELRQASEWMPIETAPKDGTLILAYVEWRDGPDQEIGAFKDGEFYPKNRDYPSLTPTLWMPRPPSPTAKEAT